VNLVKLCGKTKLNRIDVRRHSNNLIHRGLLTYQNTTIACSLGRSGITTQKREGDGATPAGTYRILYGFSRVDRVGTINCEIPLNSINRFSGWCDDPLDANYNSYVNLPFSKSHEIMQRDDRLYDICLVLDYNKAPRKRFGGSAIFFHQTSLTQGPTEGCVAINPDHMRKLLPKLGPETVMIIHP